MDDEHQLTEQICSIPVSRVFRPGWLEAQGDLKLYRAVDFPLKWQVEKVGCRAALHLFVY